MKRQPSRWGHDGVLKLCTALTLLGSAHVGAQESLNWEASRHFQFQLKEPVVALDGTGRRVVTVEFAVTDPLNGNAPWDIRTAPEFRQPAGASRLSVDFGWSTEDYQNTGAAGEALQSVPFRVVNGVASGGGIGLGPSLPILVDALRNAVPVGAGTPGWSGWYSVQATLPTQAAKSGVILLEGHPAWAVTAPDGSVTWERVPVKSVHRFFAITDPVPVERRAVVDIAKCQNCHDGKVHEGMAIPRLSLHGGNRTEEINVCVTCHNPNQTDIAYRTSGDEVPMDFKYLIHAIHGARNREVPLVVVGFRGALTDFSGVRPPADTRNCLLCHVDRPGKGSFELPVEPTVLGTTLESGSVPGSFVDVDPANDLKMSPTVGACSACHDDRETLEHMMSRRTGGSFAALQSDLSSGRLVEHCADCHGPGKKKDVRQVHGAKSLVASGGTLTSRRERSRKVEREEEHEDDHD